MQDNMTISDYIQQYKVAIASGFFTGQDNTSEKRNILENLSEAMYRGTPKGMHGSEIVQWQIELNEIEDDVTAALTFYEMFWHDISRNMAAVLSFYYCSRVIQKNPSSSEDFHQLRAITYFKNIELFGKICKNIFVFKYYNGMLNIQEYYDLVLLSDAYLAWNSNRESSTFEIIQKQAHKVQSKYSNLGRERIIQEGQNAANNLCHTIGLFMENSSFPMICKYDYF